MVLSLLKGILLGVAVVFTNGQTLADVFDRLELGPGHHDHHGQHHHHRWTVFSAGFKDIRQQMHPHWLIHLEVHHKSRHHSHLRNLNALLLSSVVPEAFLKSLNATRGVTVAAHTKLTLAADSAAEGYADDETSDPTAPDNQDGDDRGHSSRARRTPVPAPVINYHDRLGYWHQSRIFQKGVVQPVAHSSRWSNAFDTLDSGRIYPYQRIRPRYNAVAQIILADTGVACSHVAFQAPVKGGTLSRCRKYYNGDRFDQFQYNTDWHGHGTQVAGVAVSPFVGVGNVIVRSIRVFDPRGTNTREMDPHSGFSQTLKLCDAMLETRGYSWRQYPILLFSGSSTANDALDHAFAAITTRGIPVVVPASNQGVDACTLSPQRVPAVFVAGAIDRTDTWYPASGHGKCVDVLAPGKSVVTTSIKWPGDYSNTPFRRLHDRSALATVDGTSMSAGIVAGVLGSWLDLSPKVFDTPEKMNAWLRTIGDYKSIAGIPPGTPPVVVQRGTAPTALPHRVPVPPDHGAEQQPRVAPGEGTSTGYHLRPDKRPIEVSSDDTDDNDPPPNSQDSQTGSTTDPSADASTSHPEVTSSLLRPQRWHKRPRTDEPPSASPSKTKSASV
ncbi:proteinase B [Savitreella phatthalungensis]